MNTQQAIKEASAHLLELRGKIFDVFALSRPMSTNAAMCLSKIISKLSPLVGNLIEFNVVEFLNLKEEFKPYGKWVRQDPGFPDTIFEGNITPKPGFEIKAWLPLATEITARFKDSQNHFEKDQTHVALLAWLPESVIFGKPYILDVCVVSGLSVARARDAHYHDPPDYIVVEPEDTSGRTRNLQQTNTSGYKWQGTSREFKEASKMVEAWGPEGTKYQPSREYQTRLRELHSRFAYRLDTNFAKIDRIVHPEIEAFKNRVLQRKVLGDLVANWARVLSHGTDDEILAALQRLE